MSLQGAILDDYQNVAQKVADWSSVAKDVDFKVFTEGLGGQDKVIAALKDCAVVCLMRERTPFGKDVIDALPELKLIVTSGMRNAAIDMAAAAARGIPVCGTESLGPPTAELTIGLMLELARKIGFESARMKAGTRWQTTLGIDLYGKTLGIIGLGKLGSRVARVANAFDMKVIAWSENLTAEKAKEAGATLVSKEELFKQSDFVTIHTAALAAHARAGRRRRTRADEADRVFHQQLARPDRRREGDRGGAEGEQDRRRRHRHLQRGAAAARSPVPQARQYRDHAASRLCHGRELQALLRADGRGHPRVAGRQAGAGDCAEIDLLSSRPSER